MKHFSPQWHTDRVVLTGIIVILLLVVALAATNKQALIEGLAARTGAMETYSQAPTDGSTPDAPSMYVVAARWETNPVTYSISNCPRSLDCEAARQAVRQAVEAWDAVSGITLNEASGVGDINILWASGAHGDGNPFDGPGHVLAHAYFPVPWLGPFAGDVHLDDDEAWVIGNPTAPEHVDLPTTVMHEVGHALGLDHSNDPSALMWDEYTGIRGLAQDDINGIQSLYGPPNADDTAPAAPAEGTGVTATANSTLRIRTGPSTDNSQVGRVPAGSTVPVLGKNEAADWLYIDYQGTRGWVAGWYTTVNGDLNTVPVVGDDGSGAAPAPTPASPTPTPAAPTSPTGVTATAKDYARMRSGPGTTFPQVGSIPYNTTVNVLGRNSASDWLYVDYNGVQGWVAAWLFTVNGDLSSVPIVG